MAVHIDGGTLLRGAALVETSGGVKYAIFLDGSTPRYMVVYKNIDGTPSLVSQLSSVTILGTSIPVDCLQGVDVAIDSNDKIHIVVVNGNGTASRDVAYNCLDTSDDTYDYSWDQVTMYEDGYPGGAGVGISLDSSDNIHILYVDVITKQGTNCDSIYYITGSYGSWGTKEEVKGPSGKDDNCREPRITICAADDVEAFYKLADNTVAFRRRNGTWGTQDYYPVSATKPTGQIMITTGDVIYRYHKSASNNLYENGVDTGYDCKWQWNAYCTLVNDTDKYVFFIDTNDDVHLISDTGSGWEDEGVLQTGSFSGVVSEWAYHNENQSDEINYLFDNGTDIYFDSFSLGAGSQNITGAGNIASAETFGTSTITTGSVTVSPLAIGSAEVFGTPKLILSVNPSGIPPGEAFGEPVLSITTVLYPSGITSAESFGTATVTPSAVTISPSGITSAEVFGTANLFPGSVTVSPPGIASLEAFGATSISPGSVTISPPGIVSEEVFGTTSISPGSITVSPSGIVSEEVFGTASVSIGAVTVYPSGISTSEAFGTPVISPQAVTILPTGITSIEAFGTPIISPQAVTVLPSSISSEEAIGTPVVSVGEVTITPVGISSSESFGTAVLSTGSVTITPTGIYSSEAFGSSIVSTGAVTVVPSGISSAEAFGTPALQPGSVTVSPSGIVSGEVFGAVTITVGSVTINPFGISSGEVFGTVTITLGATTIFPSSIVSAEVFGTTTVAPGSVTVSPSSIFSVEIFGTPIISVGAITISPSGILSAEVFGVATLIPGSVSVSPFGISSVETFGIATVTSGAVTVFPSGILSSEYFGTALFSAVAYPDGDVSIGSWTDQDGGTTDLFDTINEVYANDSDYVRGIVTGVDNVLEESLLDVPDPNVHINHQVRYRYRKLGSGKTAKLTVVLVQGTTTIASWVHNDVSESWADATQTLTEQEAANITNYPDLRLRFIVVEV